MFSAYFIHLLNMICINLTSALSLQLCFGFTGLINLGHIAFFGIGAYTSALLALQHRPFLECFLLAGLVSMFFGFFLSVLVSRLKGDYLALATMAFSFVVYAITLNWTELTRGPLGLPGIPKPSLLGLTFNPNIAFLALNLAVTLGLLILILNLVSSPFGKVLEATRDDELAAKTLGKNTFKAKSTAFGISALVAGFAGSIYSYYLTFIDPQSFSLLQIVPVLTIVIVGGLASIKGTIIASILITLLPEPLRFLELPSSIIGPARQILYSLVLILVLLYKPRGLFGKVELE